MRVTIAEKLEQRFNELSERSHYKDIKTRTDSQVVHWRWATGPRFQLDPFHAEKYRLPKGRWLAAEPAIDHYKYLHGFNSSGQVVVVRMMTELGVYTEEFFNHSDTIIESAYYSSASGSDRHDPSGTRESVVVAQLELDEGVPVRYEVRGTHKVAAADYINVGGRLVSEHLIAESLPTPDRYSDFMYQYHYDEMARLDFIDCVFQNLATGEPPIHYICYRRPKKGQSKRELAARVAALAVRAIPETLRAAKIHDQVFNLLIVYDNENMPLPPSLALGSESFRQRAREQHGKQARCEIWNPADYEHFNLPTLELKDPELLEACELLNQQMAESDNCQLGRRLLNSVAAQLQQRDWAGILQTTDDFVVSAVDLESQDDLRKNITKSVPPELIKRLKREGLL